MKQAIEELEEILTTRLAIFAGFVPKTVAAVKEELNRDLLEWRKKWSMKEREEARLKERERVVEEIKGILEFFVNNDLHRKFNDEEFIEEFLAQLKTKKK